MKEHDIAAREKQESWAEHLRQWKLSGKSQVQYCREHGLRENRMTYWKAKLAESGSLSGRLRRVPIEKSSVNKNNENGKTKPESGVQLNVNGVTIEVNNHFNEQTLKKVLQALRG